MAFKKTYSTCKDRNAEYTRKVEVSEHLGGIPCQNFKNARKIRCQLQDNLYQLLHSLYVASDVDRRRHNVCRL